MKFLMSAFDLLAAPIRRLLQEKGWQPTLPQELAIPKILEGKNVLLIAPAGSGKTEAGVLPALSRLLFEERRRETKLLYITPLRALNRDLLDRLEWWCKSLDFRVAVRHGDTEMRERRVQALIPPDVIITTPETLQILLVGKKLSKFLKPRIVIVDEVHELAESKRGSQLSLTLERLRELAGDFQIVGLSATVGDPEEVAKFLVGVGRECEILDVSVEKKMEIEVIYPEVKPEDLELAGRLYTFPEVAARVRTMYEIMRQQKSVLIFTNTRPMAEILSSRFKLWDFTVPVETHHGSLSGPIRIRAERGLKDGSIRCLVCTSSLELGLDIGSVDLVIQYNSPRQATRLIQRVGRAGHRLTEVSKGKIIAIDSDDAIESIVIAARCLKRQLEPPTIPKKPLDVLLHSLVAMLVEKRNVKIEEVLRIFKRAYPFRDLTEEDILEVLNFAQSLERKLVTITDGEYTRPLSPQRTFTYYFENLSMIPELKQYLVIDDEEGSPVGILDESFVAEYGEIGTKFIMAGRPWKIVQIFKNKIYVKKEEDPLGCVPSWIGEEIPVPFEVAQEVGMIREAVERGEDLSEIARNYFVDENTLRKALSEVLKQKEENLPIPTHRRITIEQLGEFFVINACFGTLINRTLGRVLSHTLSEATGGTVSLTVDPYRIVLRSELLTPEHITEILVKRRIEELKSSLRETVERSQFFAWRLVQVAKRMGVIEREAEITAPIVEKLRLTLKGTPVYEETYKEVVERDMDIEGALRILEGIRSGNIEVVNLGSRKEPTPISSLFWKQPGLYLEPVAPKRMKSLILATTKARILSEIRVVACTECMNYLETKRVYEIADPKCPLCGSARIGVVDADENAVREALELRKRNRNTKIWRELVRSSKLVEKYGRLAIFALAGKNLDYQAAQRILEKAKEFDNKFLELVIEEERRALLRGFTFR